ncbi:unnamed protein product [Cyprideis torosa]|uniref:Uncharacterized protein n=1 Tax=Cyprideis torosa TaxID=163714 RepID=A0A7R8ZFH6_9CRUS|nr:unnamed protein product [Cyprideis torosa]CAG0879125.1 unnamed protein product [Cyprideis torosa]
MLSNSAILGVTLIVFSVFQGSKQGRHERKLLHDLLSNYNKLERPVSNETEPLVLSFGLTLMQIIDVEWYDYNLRWNISEYGGLEELRIPPEKIWEPDVLMYNSADKGFDGTFKTNVVVRHNGSCLYVPPGIFKSTCKIDITFFPFDDQECSMKFGSWTYSGWKLDLSIQNEDGGDTGGFIENGEWNLIGLPGVREEHEYPCCPEPYVDITFTVHIRRRTLYYFSTLIVPCVLISSMALLGFTLPPDSGEKLTLGVTILLSLTVFLNMVAEKMPSTSDAIPLIEVTILLSLTVFLNLVNETLPPVSDAIPLLGTYFNCIMFMVASSVVLTVVVLNFHHRNTETHIMSGWMKCLFLQWMPWILCMQRPGKKITRKTLLLNHKMKHLEMKERQSRSLLANVLDIDDDITQRVRESGSLMANVLDTDDNIIPHRVTYGAGPALNSTAHLRITGNSLDDTSALQHSCLSAQRELQLILKELRFVTDRMRKEDEDSDVVSDWKFAAMVVDRFCLIIFTLFTIIATIAVLSQAPHIVTD